jgi:hypothetical protein
MPAYESLLANAAPAQARVIAHVERLAGVKLQAPSRVVDDHLYVADEQSAVALIDQKDPARDAAIPSAVVAIVSTRDAPIAHAHHLVTLKPRWPKSVVLRFAPKTHLP